MLNDFFQHLFNAFMITAAIVILFGGIGGPLVLALENGNGYYLLLYILTIPISVAAVNTCADF